MSERWYVLQSKARQEHRAKINLEHQGYETFMPTMIKKKPGRGKRVVIETPLFPGYLFCRGQEHLMNFNALRSTRGVLCFVRMGGRIATIPDEVIESIMQLEKQRAQKAFEERGIYKEGTPVEVTSGPFAGLHAIYKMPRGEERCIVLLDMLGKQQRIELDEITLKSLK